LNVITFLSTDFGVLKYCFNFFVLDNLLLSNEKSFPCLA